MLRITLQFTEQNHNICRVMIGMGIYTKIKDSLVISFILMGNLHGITGRTVGHRSQPPEFKSQFGHV